MYKIFGCYNLFQIVLLSTHRINKKYISTAIGIFYKIRNFVTKSILINLYYSLIYPFLIYAVHIWGGTSDNNLRPLLDARQITDNRKFWKNIKPLFSTKTINASNIILFDNDKIIRNETDVAEKLNNYFSNVVETLNIPEIDAVTIISDHIADPIDQAIYKYSKHPSIIAIKEKCATNIKFSFQYCMLLMLEKIRKALANKIECGLLLTDLSKAVSNTILLLLKCMHITLIMMPLY